MVCRLTEVHDLSKIFLTWNFLIGHLFVDKVTFWVVGIRYRLFCVCLIKPVFIAATSFESARECFVSFRSWPPMVCSLQRKALRMESKFCAARTKPKLIAFWSKTVEERHLLGGLSLPSLDREKGGAVVGAPKAMRNTPKSKAAMKRPAAQTCQKEKDEPIEEETDKEQEGEDEEKEEEQEEEQQETQDTTEQEESAQDTAKQEELQKKKEIEEKQEKEAQKKSETEKKEKEKDGKMTQKKSEKDKKEKEEKDKETEKKSEKEQKKKRRRMNRRKVNKPRKKGRCKACKGKAKGKERKARQ